MRRKEKEITSRQEIETVINKSMVCRLGLAKENIPYIVPLCFGYEKNVLYFHSAVRGKKIDILKKNTNVCFEIDFAGEFVPGEKACDWGIHFKSVIGFGTAAFVEGPEQKRHALNIIMEKYSGQPHKFDKKLLKKTAVIKVKINHMTGKQS